LVDRYNLISISIKNFRGFRDVDIDFTDQNLPREIMTFFGHQGCGKSTIIFAIQWCAYGTVLKSNKQKLSRKNIFPDTWDGVQKETISVTMKFRDSNNKSNRNNDIICKRMLLPNKDKDEVEVIVGEKKSDKIESRDYFQQIFGSIPSVSDGVMWVVRTEEMAKMAQTITGSKDSESYFLNFMNLNVPHDGLTELFAKKTRDIKKLMPKNAGINQAGLDFINTQIRAVEARIIKKDEQIERLSTELMDSKPTQIEEEMVEHRDEYSKVKQDLKLADAELRVQRIKKAELNDLITTLLGAKLIKKGIKIKKSFDAEKFEWDKIAEYLELTNLFSTDTISQIKELQEGLDYDTSLLHNSLGKENLSKWLTRLKELKKARKDERRLSSLIDEYHKRGINENSTKEAAEKIEKALSINKTLRNYLDDKSQFEEELSGLTAERDAVEGEIAKLAKNKTELLKLRKEKKIIEALIKSIDKSNREYEKKMFDKMISSIKDYWDRIDQIGMYRPTLVQEPEPQIALERVSDGRIRLINPNGDSGTAAGGEEQLLLVCTCLAVSATSGAKMPIILDDCFTVVDKPSREALVNTVAEDFKNMIFVTNDIDKAKLLRTSQGILKLEWPEPDTSINEANIEQWREWLQWSDVND
jgi:hypothetical protein